MKLFFAMMHCLSSFFVTDFDNTLAHYGKPEEQQDHLHVALDQLVPLPPSSTGMVGYLHNDTIGLLNKIASTKVVICASGMRENTMRGRQPFLPNISYWVCENGGRIFATQPDGSLQELSAWTSYVHLEGERSGSITALNELKQQLERAAEATEKMELSGESTGHGDHGPTLPRIRVDAKGYYTMIRVHCNDEEEMNRIVSLIPPNLRYTFNLGYLDIQLPTCGKLNAIRWLLDDIDKNGGQNNSLNCRGPASPDEAERSFIFMGDDDNDVEIAAAAKTALIALPRSAAMKEWIDSQVKEEVQANAEGDGNLRFFDTRMGKRIILATKPRHEATISMLQEVSNSQ